MHAYPTLTFEAALAEQHRRLLVSARCYIAMALAFGDPRAAGQMIDRARALLDRALEMPPSARR